LKVYQKNDLVRVEVRFENVRCNQIKLPARHPDDQQRIQQALGNTIERLGQEAKDILQKVHQALVGDIPAFDRGLFKKVLIKIYRLRGIEWNRKYDELFDSLERTGGYTRSRLNPKLRLESRTLAILSDHENGLLMKARTSDDLKPSRLFYKLRPDWKERASLMLEKLDQGTNSL
jgi:hypothetical protein